MKDLLIVGGGPAGISAGVYAARKKLSTTLVTEEIGGQSVVSEGIENWIGTIKIPGAELAKSLKNHLEAYKADTVELVEGRRIVKLEKTDAGFRASAEDGAAFEAKAVLIASGAGRRKLEIPGADTFEHKGLTYCASCDGPLFAGQDVAVVGGGNAGFETAAQLLAYAKSVTLIHKYADFKADPVTVEKVLQRPAMNVLRETAPVRVTGEKFVSSLVVQNLKTGEETELPVTGIFVEIGVIPNTGFAKELIMLDPIGRIKTDPRNQRTSTDGVWAAGDCTDELYHQNNIAAGDGVKALEDIYQWLSRR